MKIYDTLPINKSPIVISIVGSGGKTSTMFALARELEQMGKKVLFTTTTHISTEQGNHLEKLIIETQYEECLKQLKQDFYDYSIVGLARETLGNKKIKGIPLEWVERFKAEKIADIILVEADGARGRPFKAPGENEPALPRSSDIVISVMGIDALNKPITESYVHRPDVILDLLGKNISQGEERLTIENIIKIFNHKKGLLKNIDAHVDIFILINKVGDLEEEQALRLGNHLAKNIDRTPFKILIGEVQNTTNPICHTLEGGKQ